jgi:hypothetical protein
MLEEKVRSSVETTQENASAAKRHFEAAFPITPNWSVERLLSMTKEETIELWSTLPAVSLEELQGHFMGIIPNYGDPERQAAATAYMYDENSVRGYWLGKAYRQTGPNEGEGYNRWRLPGGKIERRSRFITEIGKSFFDGRPSLLMYYGAYRADAPSFVDEVRKLEDYIYVGVGSVLDENGKRNPGHFIMTGPTDEWVGGATGERVRGWEKPTK